LIRLTADGRLPIENAPGSIFAPVFATHPIDLAWPAGDSLPVVVEQTNAQTYSAVTTSPGAARPASSFPATSTPIAAHFGSRDGEAALWIVLANGEILSLEDTPAGWSRSSLRPPIAARRASYDAVFIAADELAVCGPSTAAATNESPLYGMWRIRLRN
jgi:hypothetical protein